MQVGAFAVGSEDGDQFDRAVDSAEPVRGVRGKLDCVAGFDDQVLFSEDEAHSSVEDVLPVVTLVDAELGTWGWPPAPAGDPNLERTQPAGGPVGERPHRQPVTGDRLTANTWVRRGRPAGQIVGGNAERSCSTPIGALLMGWVIHVSSPRLPFLLGGIAAVLCAAFVIAHPSHRVAVAAV